MLTPRIRPMKLNMRRPGFEPESSFFNPIEELMRLPEEWLGTDFEFNPRMDFSETEDKYVLTAEMPGVDPENVDISVQNKVLELKGEKKEEKDAGGESGYKERRYGAFHRRIPLNQEIKEDQVQAKFKNGVLRIELPKTEQGGGKRIPIESD